VQIEPVGGLPLGDDAYFYGVTSEQCLSTGCRISVGLACVMMAVTTPTAAMTVGYCDYL